MKKLVIVGNGPYSQMMKKYVEQTGFGKVLAYTADAEYIQRKEMDGVPVLPLEGLKEVYSCDEVTLIMGIGYRRMGEIRREVFKKCKRDGYYFENYIHPTALVAHDVTLGEGNNILEGVIIEVGVKIGDANLFFGGSMVGHETTVGSYNTFAGKSMAAGCVIIKNHCFLGISSSVKDHVALEDYVLLGAAAYGFQDMEPYSVVAPARSIVLKDKKSTEFL